MVGVHGNPNVLHFQGSNFMRQRLILSVLTGKTISVTNIRSYENEPGLKEYEVNLLRLLDKMTNGTLLEVNETGTGFVFTPGVLLGGPVSHECCKLRGIGYYMEVVLGLAPFCKKPLSITLRGVTNNQWDPSVDSIKAAGIAVLKEFVIVDPGIVFEIRKRGMEPEGGGEVYFHCPAVKLKAIQKKEMGKVKKIRGTAYAVKVSPSLVNRFIDSAKGLLLQFLPDVFISTDHMKGPAGGKSPGFGGCIVAETTTGVKLTADVANLPASRQVPEDLGKECAQSLMESIARGGIFDGAFQALACLYITFTSKDVSQVVLGPLSAYTIEFLRHVRTFVGLMFKLEPYTEGGDEEEEETLRFGTKKVLLTGVGVGYHKFL